MTMPLAITAIFLADDENSLALDRKVLRRLGVTQTEFFASGRTALDHLRETAATTALAANGARFAPPSANMLICNERLADMTGLRFLSHVRSLPGMAHIPVLFLVCNGESPVAVAAKATNACAVLPRPYSPEQARETLKFAFTPAARHAPLTLPPSQVDRFALQTKQREAETAARHEKRPPIINRQERPALPRGEAALREGLSALQRGDVTAADKLLHGSYEADPGRIETCLALSRLFSLLHKGKEELMWLCRAIVLSLKRGEKTRAENLLARLPRGKDGQDPLLTEAGLVLQEGEAKAAALSFLEAHKLDPTRPLHTLISRTCMFTPAPEEHMRELVQALTKAGHDATANKLRWRLLQPPKEDEERLPGFLDNFPLLCDIISVATHTFKTWRHAA